MSSVLILGDSIVKNFNTEEFDLAYQREKQQGKVYVFSYPGINAEKLAVQIRKVLWVSVFLIYLNKFLNQQKLGRAANCR